MGYVHEATQNQIEEYEKRFEDPDFLDYGAFRPRRRDLLIAGTRAFWRQKGEQFGNVDSLILSHPLPPCMSVDFNSNLDNLYQDWIKLEIDHQAAMFPVPSWPSTVVDGDDAAVPEFDDTASTVVVDFNPVDDTASTVVVEFNLPSVDDHPLDSAGVDGAGVDDDDDEDEVTLKLWSPDDDADNADLDDVPVPPPAKKLRQSLLAFAYK
jgi:hypothetical protein